ncbi:MAG: primosomal protein N' [Phycisphaerales bacterium]|nr:primosomal protein N' [Phycisphaerales bacterium]
MAKPRANDSTPHLWIESGDARETPLISVAPLAPIDKIYTFTATDEVAASLRIGQRVAVPFGRKGTVKPAIIVDVTTGPWTSTLRPIKEVIDSAGELSPHLLELGKWIARYYAAPLGRTLAAMVPQAVRLKRGFTTVRRVRLIASPEQLEGIRLGKKQLALIDALRTAGEPVESDALLTSVGASRATLRALLDKELVTEDVTKEAPDESGANVVTQPDFALNDDQQSALDRVTATLDAAEFRALLLFGVSGSGKTEIYIRAMQRVLAAGKQAIMLVPEIALTTQLVQRLAARFERVAVIHSGLTEVQRSLAWEEIRTGKTPVVIGTRSAVFAPCPNPGIIVVDEEQEPSYKNLQSPRFHVRDVAIKRAHLLGIPIVLGSATPSLESWHNALTLPSYERINLPNRVRDLPMPAVRMVDMRSEGSFIDAACMSRSLCRSLTSTLAAGQQAVLLLNRRGYASWLFCTQCGRRVQCPQCNANMVQHRTRNRMLCHHCHTSTPIPTLCADLTCRGPLQRGGGGTERVEAQLREEFPNARIHRADSDTMTDGRKYQALVDAFSAGEIDVLLGTQMIAKGLDFPNVALVGVIGADLASAGADFRASERLFQLVTQVAGRAGRAEASGEVVVQTSAPETPALRFALTHDYVGFATAELHQRKTFKLPPFVRMTRFVLAGGSDSQTVQEAQALVDRLRPHVDAIAPEQASLLGPHPCAIERLRNQYRHEVLLRADTPAIMMEILNRARHVNALRARGVTVMVDVDPVNLA